MKDTRRKPTTQSSTLLPHIKSLHFILSHKHPRGPKSRCLTLSIITGAAWKWQRQFCPNGWAEVSDANMLVLDFAQALKLSISRVLQLPVLSWLVSVEHL